MAKKRRGLSRAEFLAERERKYQEAVRQTGAKTIYHVAHRCGHQAYWDSSLYAVLVAQYPCLWCGGKAGVIPPPSDAEIVHNSKPPYGHVRKTPKAFCGQCEKPGATVIVKHMTDETCCQGPYSMN